MIDFWLGHAASDSGSGGTSTSTAVVLIVAAAVGILALALAIRRVKSKNAASDNRKAGMVGLMQHNSYELAPMETVDGTWQDNDVVV